ncbi:fructose-bisphosphate aldolase class II [Mycolicibacterium sp. BK556]|uniref:class II fructose-bisphosphate aldolase n=1 Tax=unclassified Mycolicibacterium TaxID=2636767 RepID=UPI00161B4B6F|nr:MULTISPECIES: class II fructose-bisphosphate aldolase [unclassified Mycolicibacterium]MBB3603704.1 fructose-bisphosphate aldolase class II [Mycolicibacterium sp. BK556]MBB3633899.1 fructose-bisphosphate aldolase class II [Mycolicibacterium sp. BK607]
MPLARTADLVTAAYREGSGILACNVITLEHAEAIVTGAEHVGRPVILQISENAVKFHHGRLRPIAAAACAVADAATVDIAVHLDHVEDVRLLHACASTGMSSAMFDASTLDYAANVAATKAAAQWAHREGMFLEAELGEVGGKDGAHAPGVRTDPDEAVEFVAATGVDALAVAVGSSHAMSERSATLDFELIRRLRAAIPVPLVLHGSSGVPDSDLRQSVEAGITKINVGTLLNVRFTAAVRDYLAADPRVNDPRRYLAPARDAIAEAVSTLISAIQG